MLCCYKQTERTILVLYLQPVGIIVFTTFLIASCGLVDFCGYTNTDTTLKLASASTMS
jgi:hypothetical protein